MEHPKDNQRRIIREIFKYSDAVVVMIDPVVKRLKQFMVSIARLLQ